MLEDASREKHHFARVGKRKGATAVIDMTEGSVGHKCDNPHLTSQSLDVWLHIPCLLMQSLQVSVLAPENQANPAVLSKSGNAPTQQFTLLSFPAAAVLAPITSLGSHIPKLFLHAMPFLVNLFLGKVHT